MISLILFFRRLLYAAHATVNVLKDLLNSWVQEMSTLTLFQFTHTSTITNIWFDCFTCSKTSPILSQISIYTLFHLSNTHLEHTTLTQKDEIILFILCLIQRCFGFTKSIQPTLHWQKRQSMNTGLVKGWLMRNWSIGR